MLDELRLKATRLIVTGVGALAIGVTLMLSMASPAAAWTTGYHQFCWGVVLGNNGFCSAQDHDGQAGYATEVFGSGANHSVCVQARYSDGITMCSGGPNQGVYNFTPSGKQLSLPNITNNATGSNTVYASAFYCYAEGTGC